MIMEMQKLIIQSILLLIAMMPAPGRGIEIRQEQSRFQTELTRNVSRKTFMLGDFPAPASLRPPAAATETDNPRPTLAIRVSDSAMPQQQTSSESISGPDEQCAIPAVLFARGSAVIPKPAGETLLATLTRCVGKDTPLAVTGYTCDLNTQELNDTLARQRAEAMAEFLRRHGFTVAAVSSKGKSDYVTTDPGKRYLNRRVEITTVNDPPRQP